VLRAWDWDARRLKVGESNDETAEVLDGLTEGEVVSLLDVHAGDVGHQPEPPTGAPAKGVAGKEP
jgi:hypothetical protein